MKALIGYLRKFGASWLTGMSGALSVPFVALMIYTDSKYQQIIYGMLGFASLVFASFRVWKDEHDQAAGLRLQLDGIGRPAPNMPIRDLFSHIDPEFLTRTDEGVIDRWDQVGNEIRDRAALGALKIWGRAVRDGVDRMLGQTQTLRLIDPSYWTYAYFTYSFFDETSGDAPHTYLEQGHSGVEYNELQVNRSEALKNWPIDARR